MKMLVFGFIMMFAIFLDLLTLFFGLAFLGLGAALQALTPAGGAIGGAVAGAIAGCYVTANHALDIIGCAIGALGGGALGAAVGAIAGTFGAPVGAIMGEIADYCIGITGMASLFVLYWFNGMLYPTIIFGGFTAKLLPFVNEFPGTFTIISWRCIARKMAEEGGALAGVAKIATAGAALAQGNVVSATQNAAGAASAVVSSGAPAANDNQTKTEHPARIQLQDIRPANDNHPQSHLKAA
jgi:hypothetical protein